MIFVAGHGDDGMVAHVLKVGVLDYVPKRENYLERIPSVLENAVARHRLAQECEPLLVLNRLSHTVASSLDLEEIFREVAAACTLLRVDQCLISRLDHRVTLHPSRRTEGRGLSAEMEMREMAIIACGGGMKLGPHTQRELAGMGTILLCTRGEDLIRELGPLLRVEHQLAVVPQIADAVRTLLLRRFDAVVLDLDEEIVCRLEALPILRRLNPRVPILAVSTQPTLEGEAAIRAAGIFCLLVRPLAPGELAEHLAAALRWRTGEATVPTSTSHANPAGSVAG